MNTMRYLNTVIRRSRMHVWAVTVTILLASVFPVDLFPNAPHEIQGADGQYSGKQGQVLLVQVRTGSRATDVTGRFLGRRIPFFEAPDGRSDMVTGLLGIDMQDKPGMHELIVEVRERDTARRLSYSVLVLKEKYPVQHLTLPSEKVDLDDENLVRVKTEQERVNAVLQNVSRERLWDGPFVEPVQGEAAGAFGRIRVINGQTRSPHNGEDITAPLGTPVVAMNDGIAQLTVDHFFSGKGVFVDHGLGLYSMYFHLSEVLVRDGEMVKQGQAIGKVGATGRATGPHLHLGVRVNGARVNPYSLMKLSLDGTRQVTR
jgi:murein DD-endopeptidase MepM/ murein hydrolase activator NlpD